MFTATVGNPPYQAENDSAGAASVYHKFMEQGQNKARYVSMVFPTRWFISTRGEGLREFRERELVSPHYVEFCDISDSQKVFPELNIGGGVNVFLWDREKTKGTMVYRYDDITTEKQFISDGLNVHIRDPRLVTVVRDKIAPSKTLSSLVHSRDWYGVRIESTKPYSDYRTVGEAHTYIYNARRSVGKELVEIDLSLVKRSVADYKVFITKTAHPSVGYPTPRIDRVFIGEPNQCATPVFLKIGSFDTEQAAINCLRYLKTDFVGGLIGLTIQSWLLSYKNFALVPTVDFSTGLVHDNPNAILDFDSPETLDEQLATIFGLTDEEQILLSSKVRRWNDNVSVSADG